MKKIILISLLLTNLNQIQSITISNNARNNIIASAAGITGFAAVFSPIVSGKIRELIHKYKVQLTKKNKFLITSTWLGTSSLSALGAFKLTKHLLNTKFSS